jgi:hypothetical protein
MDVVGRAPTSDAGAYFRRNVWGWRPLAHLACTLCPKETAACKGWHFNDGDGLDGPGAQALADALQDQLNHGAVAAYVASRNAWLSALPDEQCDICGGTGVRRDEGGKAEGWDTQVIPQDATYLNGKHPRAGQTGWCNGCDGRGFNEAWDRWYSVDENDVREFIAFLRDSGGFVIH